jgi:hypothetical protein
MCRYTGVKHKHGQKVTTQSLSNLIKQYNLPKDFNFNHLNYQNYQFYLFLEVRPWCDGKCLPPKVACRGFKFSNQPLQKKIEGKAAYQSPQTPQK